MTDTSRLFCAMTAFIFLGLSVSVEYLPATFIIKLYGFFTQKVVVLEMIALIPLVLFWGIKDKDWGYALFLIIFMTGQVIFVNVYADNYSLSKNAVNKKPKKAVDHYYPHWNKA